MILSGKGVFSDCVSSRKVHSMMPFSDDESECASKFDCSKSAELYSAKERRFVVALTIQGHAVTSR